MPDFGSPGQCAQCGAPILWTRSSVDPSRWNRPLDMMSSVKRFVVFNGATIYADTYVNHLCSGTPAAVTRDEYVGKVVAAKPPKEHKLSRQEERNAWHSVKCPVKECGAEVNEECIQIRYLIAKGKRYTAMWPHAARRFAGLETQGLMDQSPTSRSEYIKMQDREVNRIADEVAMGERDKRNAEKLEAIYEEIVKKTRCDRCNASRGTKCWNLTDRNNGIKSHTTTPHNDRRKTYFARKRKGA